MADELPTLVDWLARKYPLAKRQTLKRMLEAGRVYVNGKPAVKLKQPVGVDDRIDVTDRVEDPAAGSKGIDPPLRVVFEDDELIVVDKPPGLLTSTVPRERRPTLLAAVRAHVARRDARARVGLIHRLDRDASGLLVFSKSDRSYQTLKSQFFHHSVTREYRAVVHGTPIPPAGRIEARLVERADGTVHATRQIGRGQRAVSEYAVLRTEANRSLVRVTLETGRKHQIRVHMAGRGTPILGDAVYGPRNANAPRLMLAATRLVIRHPASNHLVEFTLPVPQEFPIRE